LVAAYTLSDWGRYLGDTTVAMAILDRLAMNAIRLHIDGPSYRQHLADKRSHKRPAAHGDTTQD
jgi:DNA replication protein DnaC